MTTQELTLFTIAGKRAPIYQLPGRPPFMLASDLAVVYASTTKAINQAVKRRPDRFPDRYRFPLTEAEKMALRSQSVTAKRPNQYDLIGFTHGGANMLSGVLTSKIADQVAVAINDAFTEMEQRALREARFFMQKLQMDASKKPIYRWCIQASDNGWTFEQLFRATNYTKKRLEDAIKELVGMGLMAQPLPGMQMNLFANV